MIRVVLAGRPDGTWRVFRQEQWMAEVRRDPAASASARVHFDIPEEGYRQAVASWPGDADRDGSVERLRRLGAVEVGPPGK